MLFLRCVATSSDTSSSVGVKGTVGELKIMKQRILNSQTAFENVIGEAGRQGSDWLCCF